MISEDEMRSIVADKAANDGEFRNRLMASPRETVAKEFDIDIPGEMQIHVHEDGPAVAHLVLPPGPKLDETQLSDVAGGCQNKPGCEYCF